MIDLLLYVLARMVMACLQAMPLPGVARLGRVGGSALFWIDARHRRVALQNLTLCFGAEKSSAQIRALALENFRRIGETYCCAVKVAALDDIEVKKVLEITGLEGVGSPEAGTGLNNRVFATGHFGNFEILTRLTAYISGYRSAVTYRALRPEPLNKLLLSVRGVSGMELFERRTEGPALKKAMSQGHMLLVLFSDQSAGDHGLELPFFDRPCFTTPAPAVFALRYDSLLFAPICYRMGLGRWRIEVGGQIPTRDENGRHRSVEAITRDINRQLEIAVRRDPANWFWVHNRWKTARKPAPVNAGSVRGPMETVLENK